MIVTLLLSLVSGIALSLAFPGAGIHTMAWVALVPLFYVAVNREPAFSALCGFLFGLGFFGSLLWWIRIFGGLPWTLLVIFQSLYIAGFALCASIFTGRVSGWVRFLVLPALWVAFEWLRAQGLLAFTWGDVGYSQAPALPVIQFAAATGVWGVSFIVALVNSALANAFSEWDENRSLRRWYAQAGVTALIAAIVIGFGLLSLNTPEKGEPIRAAVVQGNIDQDTDEDLDYYDKCLTTYRRMTLDAASKSAELIVWPETAMPGFPGSEPYLQGWLASLSAEVNASLVVGGRDEDLRGRIFNSAFLTVPEDGMVSRYAKVRLVPFGEFVPWRDTLPLLDNYRVTPVDLTPGRGFNLLDGGPCRIGVAICFESTFPYISQTLALSGAELLCVITNDAWFLRSAAAEQHARMSVLRAVENRRYLLRAAATGVSCILDPRGRVVGEVPIWEKGTVSAEVRALDGTTFYTRHGDWFAYAALGISIAALVNAIRDRRRSGVSG